MTVVQAIIIAFFCYLGALTTPWALGTSGGWYVIGRPLVAGLICGIVLGDVKLGVLTGIAVQAVYIGLITPGGVVPADLSFVSYMGIPLAMVAGLDPEESVGISVAFGVVGVAAWQVLSVGNAGWAHLADRYAEEGNLQGIIRVNYWAQIGTFLLRAVLTFFVLYYGSAVAQDIATFLQDTVPWFTDFLGVLGGALPAVGIAILILQIAPAAKQIVWFLIGWVLMAFLGVPTVGIAVIGGLLAVVYFLFLYEREEAAGAEV
jgi:PTS system mannose-specific IIC component